MILWGGCCGGGSRGSEAPGAIYDGEADRWMPLGPGPAGNRYNHTAVWTGEEMIVWGGVEGDSYPERLLTDGAAYDPGSDTWRATAPAPLSPRERHVAVWTGEEMIVWGGSRPGRRGARLLYDGAAYDPARDRWREIASMRLPATPVQRTREKGADLHAAWTGEEVIVWGSVVTVDRGAGIRRPSPSVATRGALYDPESDRWEGIPAPPPEVREDRRAGSAIWTGEELIVWGGMNAAESGVTEGAAYDPKAKRWMALPEAPIKGRVGHAAIWTGEGMLVWGGFGGAPARADGAIYVPD